MKTFAVVVLVVATVFGRGHARVTSGVTSGTNNQEAPACPYKGVPDTINTVPFIMINKLKDCIKPSADFKSRFSAASDTDAYRRVFRSACTRIPTAAVMTCFAEVDAHAPSCLGEAEGKLWTTVIDYLSACVVEVCAEDGDVVGTIFGDEFIPMSLANKRRALSCLVATAAETRYDREADLSAYTLRKYRAMKTGRQCILNVARQGGTSADRFEHLIDKLIRSMKCLTPVTNEIVSCETL